MPPKKKLNTLIKCTSPDEQFPKGAIEQVPTLNSTGDSRRIRAVYTDIPVQHREKLIGTANTSSVEVDPMVVDASPPEDSPSQPTNPANINVREKAKRYENTDVPLKTWKACRSQYLDILLGLDGRGRSFKQCSTLGCKATEPSFRCQDCFGLRLYCRECILKRHKQDPLHFIETWDRGYFRKQPLRQMGLRVQLGHTSGYCPFKKRGHKDFIVIEANGVHTIDLDFCGCPGCPPEYEQLLEVGWWPSTVREPQTAATMSVLKLFHILNLQGQIAPTDFYRGIEQMTSGDGLTEIPDRLEQWMIIIREWRHIKMTKRAGRGHDPSGIENTALGELTIPCRCCPHPEINLPKEWESASEESRWLYTLLLAEDANFRQKARLRSTKNEDEPLGPGWATFVSNIPYLNYVSEFADQDEISHCVGFAAMWSANKKKSKGLRATGIGAVSCARHELYRPNGMGDLQIGERYCNMDYLCLSALFGVLLTSIVVSYDIACQWGVNFWTRVNEPTTPAHLRPHPKLKINFHVPKFHLEAHTPKCHAPHSLNYAPGVGRTDGEGVERNWSVLNGIASSVSMMGAGGRWDTMDDFCNFANWRKTVNLPSTLLRKMVNAIPQAVIHARAFSAFTEGLNLERPGNAVEWELAVTKWEGNHREFCPYDLPDQKLTFPQVKQQLEKEEHEKVTRGEQVLSVDGGSPTDFMVKLLGLEQTQQQLLIDIKETSIEQQATFLRRRTNLLQQIQQLHSSREKFLPGLAHYLEPLKVPEVSKSTPELIPLYPPSAIPAESRQSVCVTGLEQIEERLRFAQASEALVQLRLQLAKRTCASHYKSRTDASQRYFTRFYELQRQTETKITVARVHYNSARKSLLSLCGPGDWEKTYQVLKATDIVGLGERVLAAEERAVDERMQVLAGFGTENPNKICWDAEDAYWDLEPQPLTAFLPQLARGEGTRTLSWIWYSAGNKELEDKSTDAYLRVEWVRCRARARQWKQEVQLLEEEMRRAIEFCRWKAKWWEAQKDTRPLVAPHVVEGQNAYAQEQADIEWKRSMDWTARWTAIRKRAKEVLNRHLGNDDSLPPLDPLDIEIDQEEHEVIDDGFL